MKTLFMRTTAVAAALAMLSAPAWASGEPTVKEINVNAELNSLTDSNARAYYPDVAHDILEKIVDKLPMTNDPQGYVVTVNIQRMSLDGDTMLPDSREFNQIEGVMSVLAPDTNANTESYPIRVYARSADHAVPAGYAVIEPSSDDFYQAMIDGFATEVADKAPDVMREASSK